MKIRLILRGVIFSLVVLTALPTGAQSSDQITDRLETTRAAPIPASLPPPEEKKVNPHWVGAVNTLIPGGGQYMLGNYSRAVSQFGLESVTFGIGFAMSRLSPMTLDGVPEDLPIRSSQSIQFTTTSSTCISWNAAHTRCLISRTVNHNHNGSQSDENDHDFSKPLAASMLQEFAIKYHMVNVFESYREAGMVKGKVVDPWVDPRPAKDMFMDPFRWDNLLNPWVYIPLTLVAAATILDYNQQVNAGITPLTKMNWVSDTLFALNYMALQPMGSGAPEEMFYRGYLQNEFYHLIESPFFSIPMSALAFSYSHAPPGRMGAAVAGTYLGTLAHINHGRLGPGIALHFWSVVILGIETVALTFHAQSDIPVGGHIQFQF